MKFLALSISLFAVAATNAYAKPVNLDLAASKVAWTGKKVTGQHNGTVALKSGTIDIDGKNLKGGEFVIDMTSIKVEDIPATKKENAKLVGHLKSDDFFGVDKPGNAEAKFKITSVKAAKDKKAGTHDVTGDLTIKGKTSPITFPVTVAMTDKEATAKGKVIVDRTKYDVRYGSGKFFENLGDKMINDNFEIDLDLKATL